MKTISKNYPVLDKDYDTGDAYLADLVSRMSLDKSDYVGRAVSEWLN